MLRIEIENATRIRLVLEFLIIVGLPLGYRFSMVRIHRLLYGQSRLLAPP
jgi:hypothetical protein